MAEYRARTNVYKADVEELVAERSRNWLELDSVPEAQSAAGPSCQNRNIGDLAQIPINIELPITPFAILCFELR